MYDLRKTRNSEWIDSDLGQVLVQLCDREGNNSILIVCGDKYIQHIALWCLSFNLFFFEDFLFKSLSKQKNRNLEISVLGQLCPFSPVTAPSEWPRTLSGTMRCRVRLMLLERCFYPHSLLEEFCIYKGWEVPLGWLLLVQENSIKIVIRLTGCFLLRPLMNEPLLLKLGFPLMEVRKAMEVHAHAMQPCTCIHKHVHMLDLMSWYVPVQ